MFSKKAAAVVAGIALALPVGAVGAAQADTAAPCTKQAVKKAVKKSEPSATSIRIDSRPTCVYYWAAGSYIVDEEDEAAYLLKARNGQWKRVGVKREAKLCTGSKLPKRIMKRACVS
jgi:hypothetical protein